MDIFILGAGKPRNFNRPAAFRKIKFNTNALEWQIHTFKNAFSSASIKFLGGYKIEEIKESFPTINTIKIKNWKKQSILNTFLNAPLRNKPTIICYGDTIFQTETIQKIKKSNFDLVVCIDSFWKNRYPQRPQKDIKEAEVISSNISNLYQNTEFAGLLYFNAKLASYIKKKTKYITGKSLLDLIKFIKKDKFNIKFYDLKGKWAEFNYAQDVARFILGSKAETLDRLKIFKEDFKLAEQYYFTVRDWKKSPKKILSKIVQKFNSKKIIIRSSSFSEDSWVKSNAGVFNSYGNIDVSNIKEVINSINKCIKSYTKNKKFEDQVLLQEYIENIKRSGVVFTCSMETGAPYYKINFDEISGKTNSVTSGKSNELRNIILYKYKLNYIKKIDKTLFPLVQTINKIENILDYNKLDIEFAETNKKEIYILQIRPLVIDHKNYEVPDLLFKRSLNNIVNFYKKKQKEELINFESKQIFANMTDWNPAEIIGVRPKPLAASLYSYLITDYIWSQQRLEYGYQELKDTNLIYYFYGQPYVNVNLSLKSFIPSGLKSSLTLKLLNTYLDILYKKPQLHDKIEFKLCLNIWNKNFFIKAKNLLKKYLFTDSEIRKIEQRLKVITRKSFLRLKSDIKSVYLLDKKRNETLNSNKSPLDQILILLNNCKQYGCLAFAHAARAGFVSLNILNNFESLGYISSYRKDQFLHSLNTVNTEFVYDKHKLQKKEISLKKMITKYGHLRPGSYEISNKAYWEDPIKFFYNDNNKFNFSKKNKFFFSKKEKQNFILFLKELKSNIDVDNFVKFLSDAIILREKTKFEFTKNLSKALDLLINSKDLLRLSRNELSYIKYIDLIELKDKQISLNKLKERIQVRKAEYVLTQYLEMPFLIKNHYDFYCFEKLYLEPNFITLNKIEAKIITYDRSNKYNMKNKIILIPNADPGFDWIFSIGIAGLITQFGGANSHMAIRSAELNLPAAVGVGDKLFEQLISADRVMLDCENKNIQIL